MVAKTAKIIGTVGLATVLSFAIVPNASADVVHQTICSSVNSNVNGNRVPFRVTNSVDHWDLWPGSCKTVYNVASIRVTFREPLTGIHSWRRSYGHGYGACHTGTFNPSNEQWKSWVRVYGSIDCK